MSLVVRDDGERIGNAILELDSARGTPLSVSLQFPDRTYLGPDGRRGRGRHLFAAEPMDDGGTRFRIGPDVTAHVRESEIVTFADAEGAPLGTVGWDGIRAPPARGAPLRLSGDARRSPGTQAAGAPIRGAARTLVASPASSASAPSAAKAEAPTASPDAGSATVEVKPAALQKHRLWLPLGVAVLGMIAIYAVAILAGFIGWRVEPHAIAFEGPPGGPFTPASRSAVFQRTGGAALLASLFGSAAPLATRDLPSWLDLRAVRAGDDWHLDIAVKAAETGRLPAGRTEARVPLAFPLRADVPGLLVALTIVPVPRPAPNPAPAPVAGIDDALCDRLAGNRFDPDHPRHTPAQDEIFEITPDQSAAAFVACDPREDRTGADRRFLVQRGRLLAERALRRLAAGDVARATADMDAAVAAWRHGEAAGSAYAANLLGAYYSGTFNRPGHAFIAPDDAAAVTHWRDGMTRGSATAQTNFAAELLSGHGITADPAHALDLLRDALAKGDPRAGGILGVALYTGSPRGVPLDKAGGWPLVVAAQCLDRNARALVEQEVQRGAKPAADRHACAP